MADDSIFACKLYRKKSAAGNDYFTGRMGGVRIVLLKDRETAEDGGEIWNLKFGQATTQTQRPKPDRPEPSRSEQIHAPFRDGEIPF